MQSKKESRKLAYDVLLTISGSLKNPQSDDAESDLQRLFSMVMLPTLIHHRLSKMSRAYMQLC